VNGSERRLTLPAEDCTAFHGAGNKGWPGSFWRFTRSQIGSMLDFEAELARVPRSLSHALASTGGSRGAEQGSVEYWIAETLSLLPLVALVPLGVLLK